MAEDDRAERGVEVDELMTITVPQPGPIRSREHPGRIDSALSGIQTSGQRTQPSVKQVGGVIAGACRLCGRVLAGDHHPPIRGSQTQAFRLLTRGRSRASLALVEPRSNRMAVRDLVGLNMSPPERALVHSAERAMLRSLTLPLPMRVRTSRGTH